MSLHNIIPFAHQCLINSIAKGDNVLDATAGNGLDTCILAQAVGENGCVWAFDIQQTALDNTAQRLAEKNLQKQVSLILDDHQHLERHIQTPISAAIFNLGYLPSGDKNISTQANSTQIAIQKSLQLLRVGGTMAVVIYGGHSAGAQERDHLLTWAQTLPQQEVDILHYQFANRPPTAPFALIFERKRVQAA